MQYDVGDSARRHAHFPYTFACAYYVDVEDGCSPIVFEGKPKVPAETGRPGHFLQICSRSATHRLKENRYF